MKSGREGHSPVICSTIPDKRSLVIQNHRMTLIKIWSLRAGNNLLNRLAGQKDREREGRGVGVDQNDNKLNQSQEKHWQTLISGLPSWVFIQILQTCIYPGSAWHNHDSGCHSLGRHIPGLFPAALGDSAVCTRHFFFSPKYSVFYKNNCIFKYYFVLEDFLLCPQPRTEMGGIIGPITGKNECRRAGLWAWDAQDQISQWFWCFPAFFPQCPQSPAAGNTAAGAPCPAAGWLQGRAGVEKKGQLVLLGETPYREL